MSQPKQVTSATHSSCAFEWVTRASCRGQTRAMQKRRPLRACCRLQACVLRVLFKSKYHVLSMRCRKGCCTKGAAVDEGLLHQRRGSTCARDSERGTPKRRLCQHCAASDDPTPTSASFPAPLCIKRSNTRASIVALPRRDHGHSADARAGEGPCHTAVLRCALAAAPLGPSFCR